MFPSHPYVVRAAGARTVYARCSSDMQPRELHDACAAQEARCRRELQALGCLRPRRGRKWIFLCDGMLRARWQSANIITHIKFRCLYS